MKCVQAEANLDLSTDCLRFENARLAPEPSEWILRVYQVGRTDLKRWTVLHDFGYFSIERQENNLHRFYCDVISKAGGSDEKECGIRRKWAGGECAL